jgi:hypothetical protein
MSQLWTRRRFLKTAGATASVSVLAPVLFESCTPTAAAPAVRRDVGGMNAQDLTIVLYAKAVQAMQALPASNPLSWTYQAAIHGTTLAGSNTAWNTCEHGSYLFWSWHRMYLYWFERIVRKMCGDPGWALPFWNYTAAGERQLPAMFRDQTSVLYVAQRNPAINDGTGSLPASDVDPSAGLAITDFTAASSALEGTPHDVVHVDVGGLMGSVPTAAQDPIFYLHHCNMDRLWNAWLQQGGGRSDPLADATWKGTQFTFFDENGNQVQMTSCDVLRAAQQLFYTYEGAPPQVESYCNRLVAYPVAHLLGLFRQPAPMGLTGRRTSFQVPLAPLRERLRPVLADPAQTLVLQLDGVEADRQPGVVWQVHVGLPESAAADAQSASFVGNVALFSRGIRADRAHAHGHGYQPASFSFAINRAVQAALQADHDALTVSLEPHGILIDGKPSVPVVQAEVSIASASLAVRTMERR